jgi:iron complex outermembrane receptor protein
LASESFNIEDDFLKSLDSVNEIATTTKLNVDKTTSLITTLESKKLKKLGVNSIYDALRYIPGIELRKESSGVKSVIFRGSITKGEVKFMVDGVEINNAYRASFYYFLDFPIELISRIEVLRGSGSVIHGSGAISGVINIVTKSSQNVGSGVFLGGGSYSYGKGGGYLNISEENYQLSLDSYYQENNKVIDSTDQRLSDYSVGLNFKAYDFEFNARVKNSVQGNSFGVFNNKSISNFTPDYDKNKYDNENTAIFSTLNYAKDISKYNELKLSLNYSEYAQTVEALHTSGNDLLSDFKEKSYSVKAEVKNKSFENNELLIGTKIKRYKSVKTKLDGLTGISNIVTPNLERDVYSLYLKNNYLLTTSTNVEVGIRYDDYSDFGNNTTPHLGFVYRLDDTTTFKLKHSQAFRAPSWTELYGLSGNKDLKSENSTTTEFGAIYNHSTQNKISVNIYHSKINDYIFKYQNAKYSQDSELNLRGAELDYVYNPAHNLELNLLASYTEPEHEDKVIEKQITNFLTTTSLIYTSDLGITYGTTLRYKNTKDMDNDVILDQALSYSHKAFDIQLIAKNLFDSDIIYYDANHDKANPIEDAKRQIFLNVSWVY